MLVLKLDGPVAIVSRCECECGIGKGSVNDSRGELIDVGYEKLRTGL